MLRLITPLTLVWRREFQVDAADLVAATSTSTQQSDSSPALGLSTVDITEGQWITPTGIFTTGREQKPVATLVGATPPDIAFAVYAGGDRFDVTVIQGVTALFGNYVAETDQFNTATGVIYAVGDKLTVADGVLTPASAGDTVFGIVESPLFGVSTRFANGLLRFAAGVPQGIA